MLTLHFDQTMIIGLCMIPGGIVLGILLMLCLLAEMGWEIGAFAGFVPGLAVAAAGVAMFLVGLGQEMH